MEEYIQELVQDDGVEDAGTIRYDSEDENKVQCIYPASKIKIDRVQFSIFELKRRYDRGLICLDPDFQRNFVWKQKQKSELIESVIMGIPLPLIYLAETMEGNLVIVDGRQRLTTFFHFMDNKFALNGLKILPDLNGCRFSDFEEDKKKRKFATDIEDFQLVIQIIKYPTPDRVRFDIFDRVNRGGTPLNNQEMRNALYQGKSTRLLSSLAESEQFQNATGKSISPTHMKDRYIILRAVSFWMWREGKLKNSDGEEIKYRSDIEEFLGYAMEQLNRASDQEIATIQEIFLEEMLVIYDILGEDAFRIPTENKKRRPVSMILFESLFYFFRLIMKDSEGLDPSDITKAVQEIMEDSVFLEALTYNVDSAVHVEERFRVVTQKYKELLDVK
ncbi:MAG: DUF262 domain-containing protein [Lachnospiraceae bacterium]|jgi:hypothetical protein